jgi:large subunit ribosomal protein L24
MKLKKGDKVVVIAGKEKGNTGTIVRVLPERDMVVLDKMNMVKRHRRATQMGRAGQIVDKPMPIHASNVMIADPKNGKPTRIKISREGDKRTRVAVKSGENIA